MKLYEHHGAPNAMRVRLFLAEKGIIDVPLVEIDIIKGENLEVEYLAKTPRGLSPLLELDDGGFINETVAICRYFELLQPQPSLMGSGARTAAVIESRQRQMEFDGLLPLADIFRNSSPNFKHRGIPGATEVDAIEALVTRGKDSYKRFLTRLEDLLAVDDYIAGANFSIADITALCAIDFAKLARITIPEHHRHTRRWYEQVSNRPSTDT